MGMISTSYGLATVAVLLLSLYANRPRYNVHVDAVGCSLLLLLFWAICNVLMALYGPPDAMRVYPVMDLIGTAVGGVLSLRRPAYWKSGLTLCFLTQSTLDALFWIEVIPQASYLLLDNILYAMELLCVAIPGGLHLAGRIGAHLSGRGLRSRVGLSR